MKYRFKKTVSIKEAMKSHKELTLKLDNMNTYRITILNDISKKKRRINIEAISFERAVEQSSWIVHHASENIVKAEIWKTVRQSLSQI